MDVKGSIVDVKGATVDVKGSTVDVKGLTDGSRLRRFLLGARESPVGEPRSAAGKGLGKGLMSAPSPTLVPFWRSSASAPFAAASATSSVAKFTGDSGPNTSCRPIGSRESQLVVAGAASVLRAARREPQAGGSDRSAASLGNRGSTSPGNGPTCLAQARGELPLAPFVCKQRFEFGRFSTGGGWRALRVGSSWMRTIKYGRSIKRVRYSARLPVGRGDDDVRGGAEVPVGTRGRLTRARRS
eukprot:1189539-Prorocentrum_minimum.AAC.1